MGIIKKIHFNSPVILTFTILSFVALILGFLTNGYTNMLFFSVYDSSFLDPLTYVRLFGHVLGHANFEHFFGNFMFILLIGPILEEKYGSLSIFIMICFTAVVTGLLNMLFFDTALLGASGIVFMFIILGSIVNFQSGRIPLTSILVVIIFLGKEVWAGIFIDDSISRITHIIGGVCGAVLGFYINNKKAKKNGSKGIGGDVKKSSMHV